MLAICIVLVSVDIIEMIKLISAWTIKDKIEPLFFDSCIKVDLLVKTAFSVFSLLAALSAFILVSMMITSLEFFIEKLMQPFLYLNYNIFGLYMLGFSLFGIIHWNEVAFICDKKNPDEKNFLCGEYVFTNRMFCSFSSDYIRCYYFPNGYEVQRFNTKKRKRFSDNSLSFLVVCLSGKRK